MKKLVFIGLLGLGVVFNGFAMREQDTAKIQKRHKQWQVKQENVIQESLTESVVACQKMDKYNRRQLLSNIFTLGLVSVEHPGVDVQNKCAKKEELETLLEAIKKYSGPFLSEYKADLEKKYPQLKEVIRSYSY